jgi:hypothetical protein
MASSNHEFLFARKTVSIELQCLRKAEDFIARGVVKVGEEKTDETAMRDEGIGQRRAVREVEEFPAGSNDPSAGRRVECV